MKRIRIITLLLVLPVFFTVSCKKDSDSTQGPVYKEPTGANTAKVVDVPAGLNTKANAGDIGASISVSYMGLANAVAGFSSSFMLPSNKEMQETTSNSSVYFWSYQGYSYWMTFKELSDKYTWTYDYKLPTAARFTYISAEEGKDGKSGKWTIYNPEAVSVAMWTYTWSINASNTFTANMVMNETGRASSTFDIISNSNKSGSFIYKIGTVKQAEITWTANGSTGTFWVKGDATPITGTW